MQPLTAADPESHSPDLIAQNVAQLKRLFPEAFTEGRIDFDVLRQLLGDSVEEAEEKYGLNWHGKRAARRLALTPSTGTLRPCPEESVDWDTTQNLMIEGDNLEVLKLLQRSYTGKVKLIYIDPPYNTGNDFVYPDDYRDSVENFKKLVGWIDDNGEKVTSLVGKENPEASGRFHTNWLNMMYPRLKLARNLLNHEGAVFISINDNELASLKLVCDDIFGQECYGGCVARVTGTPTGGGFRTLVNEIDNVLVYFREPDVTIEGVAFSDEDAAIYDKEDANGRYLIRPLRRTGGEDRREDRPSMFYALIAPDGEKVFPIAPAGYESRWICGRAKYDELYATGLIEWLKVERNGKLAWQVYQKFYVEGRLKQPSNLWDQLEGNKKATRDLRALFDGEKVFSFPKPIGLVRHIIQLAASAPDSIVLDFFAGSGTTGHAVMASNADDGARRRFILVQLPEPLDPENKDQKIAADFCDQLARPRAISELTKERLRRAGTKIRAENPLYPGDLGFRVFKLDSSNIHAWDPRPDDLPATLDQYAEHLKADRTEQDILYEVLLKLGFDLCAPIAQPEIAGKTVYSVGEGRLIVCLPSQIGPEDVEPLGQGLVEWWRGQGAPPETRLILRDSAFADDVVKTNLTAILAQGGLANVRSL